MIADLIAYASSFSLMFLGCLGIIGVAIDKISKERQGAALMMSIVLIFLAWLIAHLAGI
jgi:hypothetical protein